MKWDGVRAIAHCTPTGISLWSRNLREITGSYPEIVTALTEITDRRTMLLDGELVAPDDHGAPSFSRLQRRMHVRRPSALLIDQVRVDYIVFDLLGVDDQSLLDDPYRTRRAELADLTLDDGEHVRVPPMWSLAETDAEELLRIAADSGLEGIVCKHGDSIYEPGRRSSAWTKVVLRLTTEAVIVGAVPGNGVASSTPRASRASRNSNARSLPAGIESSPVFVVRRHASSSSTPIRRRPVSMRASAPTMRPGASLSGTSSISRR